MNIVHDWITQNKSVTDSQAHVVHKYKNLKHKVPKCNASVYFNKKYLDLNLIPKCTSINVSRTSPGSNLTRQKIHIT